MAGKGSAPRPKSVDEVNAAALYKRANEITEEHLQADRPARLN